MLYRKIIRENILSYEMEKVSKEDKNKLSLRFRDSLFNILYEILNKQKTGIEYIYIYIDIYIYSIINRIREDNCIYICSYLFSTDYINIF